MTELTPADIVARFANLTTAHLTDGCVRAGQAVRCGPAGLAAVEPGSRLAGRALPVRHAGSVDIFLEKLESSEPGDVLVVDNEGRLDEACVGDLMTLEAQGAGLAGIVIWGLHRDSAEIREIGLPVFSLGSMPTGPLRLDPRAPDALDAAAVGQWTITHDDLVFADDDGVLFVPAASAGEVLIAAERVRDTERAQAEKMHGGTSLRDQLRFAEFLEARTADPSLTLRQHLANIGGAIEV
jgi:regulator of RNase E activity RraA